MTEQGDTSRSKTSIDTPVLKRGQTAQAQRDARSKLALKANMARRKAQVRARDDKRDDKDADQGTPEDGQQE